MMDAKRLDRRARLIRWGGRCQKLGLQLTALGFLGGLAGVVSRESAGLTEAEQRASGSVILLYWVFGVMFLMGLLVVLPASSIFYRRAGVVIQRDANSPGSDGDSEKMESDVQHELLPTWLGWPIGAVVTIASLLLIYAVLFHGLPARLRRG
jgi:hypothetical protein